MPGLVSANLDPGLAGDYEPSVLHYHDYRLYLATSFFSALAAQAQKVAVGWQLCSITHSPLALGYAGLPAAVGRLALALLKDKFAGYSTPYTTSSVTSVEKHRIKIEGRSW